MVTTYPSFAQMTVLYVLDERTLENRHFALAVRPLAADGIALTAGLDIIAVMERVQMRRDIPCG